jgi:hypothetical protein
MQVVVEHRLATVKVAETSLPAEPPNLESLHDAGPLLVAHESAKSGSGGLRVFDQVNHHVVRLR